MFVNVRQFGCSKYIVTVAKYDPRKILIENLASLTVKTPKSATNRRWKFVIFACWPSNFVFRNSFILLV